GASCTYTGGVISADPKEPPLDDIVTYDPEQKTVESGAPGGLFRRSHHDAAELNNKCLCVVGGWDGAHRTSSVFSYDTETAEWAPWAEHRGGTPPAGLSSHTCTKISQRELCVVGREGGVRTQRRYASVYTLQVNASDRTYRYKEEESRTASRSGHSAALLKTTRGHGWSLYVLGGRESGSEDLVGYWKTEKVQVDTSSGSRLVEQLSRLVSSDTAKHEAPRSLRHHSCSVIGPFLVIFGGEALGHHCLCLQAAPQ
ncbi:hypothetical protein GDO81_019953, partial [Engystomops pustulosus]